MNFLDLFAGIGGFRLGFQRVGANPIGYVEWDGPARLSYQSMYDVSDEWSAKDITKVSKLNLGDISASVDIITGGFPCQAFSVAGKRKGFQDIRGTLFFEVARLAEELNPKAIILENVKGLVNHNNGDTLDTIVYVLNAIGYVVDFEVLNSKDFGVPQNRERVFIIAIREDLQDCEPWVINGTTVVPNGKRRISQYDHVKTFNFKYPKGYNNSSKILDVLESTVDEGYYLSNELTQSLILTEQNKLKITGDRAMIAASRGRYIANLKSNDGSTTTAQHLELNGLSVSNTLTSVQKDNYVMEFSIDTLQLNLARGVNIDDTIGYDGVLVYNDLVKTFRGSRGDLRTMGDELLRYRIRNLTPKEYFRLQAFPDELFEKARGVNSNTQLYKQAGNSVTVNVVEEIAKEVLNIIS